MAFIDAHREDYGVESICRVLPIAPSTYYTHKGREADPEKHPPRRRQDEALKDEIDRIWNENFGVYGVRKVWASLKREGWQVARHALLSSRHPLPDRTGWHPDDS